MAVDRFDWLELEATAGTTEVLARPPQDAPGFFRVAQSMREAGHFRSAVQLYERAVGLQPHHYDAWVELIDTLVRARQLDAAEAHAVYALDTFRQVRVLYASRALVLLHRGKPNEAEQHVQIALEGDRPSWYAKCVEAEMWLRRTPEARRRVLQCLATAVTWTDTPWAPHFLGGWMLLDAGLPTLAAAHFAEACHWNPRAPLTWLCLGDCFRDLRLYDQALFYYERALELEPAHPVALRRKKQYGRRIYGLMRLFDAPTLRERWRRRYEDTNSE